MAASLAPECNEMKEKYDTCFLKWYSEEFLKKSSTSTESKDKCDGLFKDYQKCLQVALKQKGIDKLVEEAREDQKENDHVYMGRK
ncbi:mitochondrial distribution/morphology protein [Grosmannia clavigera kw1407]|uniref:Mitochondrial distribution/morphology protein n=1 Tax=Grosmannia clavigera (strain kw1407 / UAMH 11150) TaxID=655863 RepID=F0XN86_GROCL|nr:mitochondrial distribution/morphology protein [Grosmannia clavigera kw1407]EFX00888.1 mitochondrial distribution/morphology protein [Grosmannia clavigera kw1407]